MCNPTTGLDPVKVAYCENLAKSRTVPVTAGSDDWLSHPDFTKAACDELNKQLANTAFDKPLYKLGKVIITKDEWSDKNGILTAALKTKRAEVDKRYKDRIAKMLGTK